MTTKVVPGQVIALRDAKLVAPEAATLIAKAIRAGTQARGRAAIALSGGNTPRDAYGVLARETGIDWRQVHVFWVDERAAPPTDDRSNYRWAKATLLDLAKVPAENVHRMVAESADRDAAARDYEKAIREHVPPNASEVPSFDVMVLGIGDDGHTASLFPGESTVDIRDRLVAPTLAAPGREARMTMTAPLIEQARNVVVIAVGAFKGPALEAVWNVKGDLHQTPARVIRSCHGELVWIVDRAAAGLD